MTKFIMRGKSSLVVADTFERARHAAHLVKVEYDAQTPIVEAKAVFKEAPQMGEVQVCEEFCRRNGQCRHEDGGNLHTTSTELHAPMEPHAIIAHWRETDASLSTNLRNGLRLASTYAELFGLPSEKVRIIIPYLGGAFQSVPLAPRDSNCRCRPPN